MSLFLFYFFEKTAAKVNSRNEIGKLLGKNLFEVLQMNK